MASGEEEEMAVRAMHEIILGPPLQGPPPVEVTRTMMRTGASVIESYRQVSDDEELAWRVYTAMQEARSA